MYLNDGKELLNKLKNIGEKKSYIFNIDKYQVKTDDKL